MVPFSAGGTTDVLTRAVAEKMSENLGQSVVVENRGGANTMLATQEVARAEPDGYTLLMVAPNYATNPSLVANMPYETPDDFESIGIMLKHPQVLVARASLPADSIEDLIALAKKPTKITLANSGKGTQAWLSGVLFDQMTGIRLLQVPYKGGGPAMTALLGGHVDLLFTSMSTAAPHRDGGKIKLLGWTSLKPRSEMPDLKTIDAQGVNGFEALVWYGMVAPKGTPPAIIDKIHDAVKSAEDDPEVQKRLAVIGGEAEVSTPKEMDDFVHAEMQKWSKAIEGAGFKPE